MKSLSTLLLALLHHFSPLDDPTADRSLVLRNKAFEALTYCKANQLNTKFCILVNMSIHSGKKRLFVYDFVADSVLSSGLCSHGCCNSAWGADFTKEKPTFSNTPESHCSSLGKYKVGKRGYSSWGINVNYRLHGLEKNNSNAYSRLIVLHSWEDVPNREVYPNGTPEGWGCPAVSNEQMKTIDRFLSKAKKPVLFWIYQ